jgi:hypothetical protein
VATPVDATNVPADLDCVRTMFNGFHHFAPDAAGAILADAVAKRGAIAIVEAARHRSLGFIAMPCLTSSGLRTSHGAAA